MSISNLDLEAILIITLVVWCLTLHFRLNKAEKRIEIQRVELINLDIKLGRVPISKDIPSKLEELEVRIVILEDK